MKKRLVAVLGALCLLLPACRQEGAPAETSLAPAEEDRLVVYTSHTPVLSSNSLIMGP